MFPLALITVLSPLVIPAPPGLRFHSAAPQVALTGQPSANISVPQLDGQSDGRSRLQQGLQLYQTEQFSEAITVLQQAVDILQAQGDSFNQALALNDLSLAHQQLGQWEQAQTAITLSLKLAQPAKAMLAQALNSQGGLQLAMGQPEKALASWEQATVLYAQLGDASGKLGGQINQAQALQALGLYRRALILLTEVNHTLQQQPDSPLKATGLLSLGNTLRVIGVLDQQKDAQTTDSDGLASRQVLEQSLGIAQKVQAPNELKAEILLSLGNTAQAQQKSADALDYYTQAAQTPTSPLAQLQASLNQLRLLEETGDWATAQAQWAVIQTKFASLPPSRKLIYARLNFAQSLICLKQNTESTGMNPSLACHDLQGKPRTAGVTGQTLVASATSASQLQRPLVESPTNRQPSTLVEKAANPSWTTIAQIVATAVQDAKRLDDKRAEAYALGMLGGLYEQTEQWDAAQNLTQQALKLAEGIAAPDIAYRWYWQLGRILKTNSNPNHNSSGAIAAYSKAVDILRSLRSDLVAINREVQFSFQERVEPVYRELVSLLLQAPDPSQDKLAQARNVIEALQLAELDNFFRKACLDAKPVQIDQIDQTAAVIYPVLLPDRLEVIVSLPDTAAKQKAQKPGHILRHHTLRMPQATIEAMIESLKGDLVTRTLRQYLALSEQMYDWLIRPIEADLEKGEVKNLVFVLDGSLRSIPMAALYDKESKKFLIEKNYNIALTPGLQLVNPRPLPRGNLRMLAAGLTEAREPNFSALPNVRNELNDIRTNVTSEVLLNEKFTRTTLKQEVKAFAAPIVHLATHGQFGSTADETFVLTYDDRLSVEDLSALLQSRETNRQGAIELLVLSACKTAQGDKRAALGIAGMAVRSGARSTLASLWTVDDEATAVLMQEFYRNLANPANTKAASLKKAQLKLLSDRRYRHPYFWAPFILVGNWL